MKSITIVQGDCIRLHFERRHHRLCITKVEFLSEDTVMHVYESNVYPANGDTFSIGGLTIPLSEGGRVMNFILEELK